MATRMTTLAYGSSTDSDELYAHDSGAYPTGSARTFEQQLEQQELPEKQRDTLDEHLAPFRPEPHAASGSHALLPTWEMRAYDPARDADTEPSVRGRRGRVTPVALPSMLVGLVVASAILSGLAFCAIAIAWAASLSGLAYLALMGFGGYCVAAGVATLIAAPTLRLSGGELTTH